MSEMTEVEFAEAAAAGLGVERRRLKVSGGGGLFIASLRLSGGAEDGWLEVHHKPSSLPGGRDGWTRLIASTGPLTRLRSTSHPPTPERVAMLLLDLRTASNQGEQSRDMGTLAGLLARLTREGASCSG